ncbi:hypothetical protein R1sor_008551 [Riccia sorocarpa]|uniref:Uncharacterized protein n=1 Tax=Riccia sorocarpa TaxID=122646 RepID=A0ABD3HXC4_9MARC
MGRKSHKEVIPLVCCSDQTFAAFEKFVVSWKLGKISDVHGALGRPTNEKDVKVDRDFSQLSVNRFRPVNGLLDKELRLVWTELEKGSVCITKPAKLQGPDDIVTLKDFCKAIKGKRTLGTRIVKYWETRETVVGETAVEDVSSSDEEEGSKKKKKLKKKSGFIEPLPSQVVTSLHRIYCAKHGEELPERLEPFAVLHLHKDISQYQLTLDEKLTCKLKWFARYKAAKKPASSSQPGGASQLASTSQAALTSQRSSPSHHDEQSKEDELAVAEDEVPFVLDDILKANVVERLGNRATIECITEGYAEEIKSVTEAISDEFKHKQVDGGTDVDLNLLSEVDGGVGLVPTVPSAVGGGTDLVHVVPSEVGGGSDLAPTPPSEVEEKTDEVPTLPDDFIPRGEYDSIKERSAAEVMKGIETEEHHGVPAEHTYEHLEPSEQSNAPGLLAQTSDGLLAPIETPISWVPDLNQVLNPLVKASDLLPRKLLILDVEGLLLYAEGFMDRSSKTAAGDVVGAKKVIRRNGV